MMRLGALGVVAVMVLAGAAACGDDDGGGGNPDATSDGGADGTPVPDGGADGAASGPCSVGAPRPMSVFEAVVDAGGRSRAFITHVPPGYDGSPTPLVIAFHQYQGNALQFEAGSLLSAKADQAGFIVAYPSGNDAHWNGGDCCYHLSEDDVAFTAAIIDELATRHACIDARRVYATGFENGAWLAHRLACELPDRIAAIAAVGGVIGMATCAPARPVPVLQIHGDADMVVAWGGGGYLLGASRSVTDTIAHWKSVGGCAGANVQTLMNGSALCETQGTCTGADVELCRIGGGGHSWPGGMPIQGGLYPVETPTMDMSANDVMWRFFQAHPLP